MTEQRRKSETWEVGLTRVARKTFGSGWRRGFSEKRRRKLRAWGRCLRSYGSWLISVRWWLTLMTSPGSGRPWALYARRQGLFLRRWPVEFVRKFWHLRRREREMLICLSDEKQIIWIYLSQILVKPSKGPV